MARIIGFTYGELRGKIGGTVYSRNKAGAYARAKVTPVNPQTVRQQDARYRFGNASILFQNLSNTVKNCWQTFAMTHFNPLKGNNTGIYSAGNAFVALRQSASQGNRYKELPSIVSGAGAVTVGNKPYVEGTEPPSEPTSFNLKSIEGNNYAMNVSAIQIGEDGTYALNIGFPSAEPTNADTYNSFMNAEDQLFGLSVYISNPLKFEGSKPNTALKLNYIDTGVIDSVEKAGNAPLDIVDGLIVKGGANFDPASVRDFPCVGDWVLATAFVRSETGAQKLISSKYVLVEESVA